jgi:hypothetical protein
MRDVAKEIFFEEQQVFCKSADEMLRVTRARGVPYGTSGLAKVIFNHNS